GLGSRLPDQSSLPLPGGPAGIGRALRLRRQGTARDVFHRRERHRGRTLPGPPRQWADRPVPAAGGGQVMAVKWFGLGAVVVACLGYLIFAATGSSAEYYQTISEMRGHPSNGDVRVLGTVQDDVARSDGGLHVRFTAAEGGQTMPVDYHGTLPDI